MLAVIIINFPLPSLHLNCIQFTCNFRRQCFERNKKKFAMKLRQNIQLYYIIYVCPITVCNRLPSFRPNNQLEIASPGLFLLAYVNVVLTKLNGSQCLELRQSKNAVPLLFYQGKYAETDNI